MSPDIRSIPGGELGILRAVQDDQRLLVVTRDLVVHLQPLQLDHEVHLETGLDFAETGMHEVGHINAAIVLVRARVVFHLCPGVCILL